MYDHFPAPDAIPLPVFDGLEILVKARLTVGDERRARRRMYYVDPRTPERLLVDPTMGNLTTVLAYLLDWNVTRGGTKVEIRALALAAERDESQVAAFQRVIEDLDPITFEAIAATIKAHEHREDEVRAAVKKSPDGEPSSTSTSSSPSVPGGASNMFAASTATTTPTS